MAYPKISFGIIVLNGEPFTRYNLRALYPFAHQIIVVEGAVPAAASISTPNGHSTDGTLEVLRKFKEQEDPENKVTIVTAEDEGYPNGFWPGEKDEMSRACAKRATGDYLWQVDIDEFYKPNDMQFILKMLQNDPEITAVSFKQITFWGGFDYVADGWYLRWGARIYHRLFKWDPSYCYATHRPPTVHDAHGRDLRTLKWIDGTQLAQQGVFLYHYSLVFPKQVTDKCVYYSQANWATHAKDIMKWMYNNYLNLKNPFRVHNVYQHSSWLERFQGQHPPEILCLQQDIKEGRINIELRHTNDVEQLLQSQSYSLKCAMLKMITPISKQVYHMRNLEEQIKRKIKHAIEKI